MKKVLFSTVAALVSGACSAAPSVTAYGLFDVSMSFVHADSDSDIFGNRDSFTMENGLENGSRWGLRGSEDLGKGVRIGFSLESGIESDTGSLDSKQGGRLFGREALMSLESPYGKFWFGRMHIFGSVLGENGLFRAIDPIVANYTSAIGSGYATASMWTRVDNAVSYRTPTVSGLTGYALYSFKADQSANMGREGHSESERYASAALRYQKSTFEGILVADTTLYGNAARYRNVSNGVTVTLGGNYTFENNLKFITFVQYFDNQFLNVFARGGVARDGILAATEGKGYGFVDGWGSSIGLNYPVAGGIAKLSANYRKMDNREGTDFSRYTLAAAYDYSFSRRTSFYTLFGFSEERIESTYSDLSPGGYQLALGMIHKF